MFCPNCGSQIKDGNSFCPNCGAKIESQNQQAVYENSVPPIQNKPPIQNEPPKKSKAGIVVGIIIAIVVIIGIVVGVLFATGTIGNSSDESTNEETSQSTSQTTVATTEQTTNSQETYTVGICQTIEFTELNSATNGFEQALTDRLGDRVVFDKQIASGEVTDDTTICNSFVASGVDLIMANGTDALVSASTATTNIPIVGTSISSYGVALDLNNKSTTKTGINVTGTVDVPSYDEQASMIKEWMPNAKKVGIIYCTAEKNSSYQAEAMSKSLKAIGFEVKEYTCADSSDVATVAQLAFDNSDVIYVPTDNTVGTEAQTLNSLSLSSGVPVFTSKESICEECGVATLTFDYYDMGYQAGIMAYDILVNGANPATMDIQFTPSENLVKKYDAERCKSLGLTAPSGYIAIE
jgi:putative ABC transport system substrate-binding protein